jgi:hypothetical protein
MRLNIFDFSAMIGAVDLGSFPWFVAGRACFGFGLAGWMLTSSGRRAAEVSR